MRARSWFLVASVATLSVACGERGQEEWGGTLADSAGITVVHNPATADWSIVAQPTLTEELRIGSVDEAGPYQFGQIGMPSGIDVAPDGRIVVLDQQASQVRVFTPAGRHLASYGKRGAGPGELSQAATAVMIGPGDTIFVADIMQQRMVRYAPDGTPGPTTALPMMRDGIPFLWRITPERKFAVHMRTLPIPGMTADSTPMKDRILLREPDGTVLDTLLELESGRSFEFRQGAMPTIRLFQSEPAWTLLEDGRIAHGRSDNYRIEILNADGTVDRVISRPFERAPVTQADREAWRDLMRKMMSQQPVPPQMVDQFVNSMEFAEFYPAFASLMGGPHGTLWVQHVRTAEEAKAQTGTFSIEESGGRDWDIYDREGRLLGTLQLPAKLMVLRVIGEHLYGIQRDDLDVQHVVRLKLSGWGQGV